MCHFAAGKCLEADETNFICLLTPLKINIEPENDGLEDDVPFQLGDF